MGRARQPLSSIAARPRGAVAERSDRFEGLFGVRRGGGGAFDERDLGNFTLLCRGVRANSADSADAASYETALAQAALEADGEGPTDLVRHLLFTKLSVRMIADRREKLLAAVRARALMELRRGLAEELRENPQLGVGRDGLAALHDASAYYAAVGAADVAAEWCAERSLGSVVLQQLLGSNRYNRFQEQLGRHPEDCFTVDDWRAALSAFLLERCSTLSEGFDELLIAAVEHLEGCLERQRPEQ